MLKYSSSTNKFYAIKKPTSSLFQIYWSSGRHLGNYTAGTELLEWKITNIILSSSTLEEIYELCIGLDVIWSKQYK